MESTTGALVEPAPGHAEDRVSLTSMQQGMLFESLNAGSGSGVYVQQAVVRMFGPYRVEAFTSAWKLAAQRHDALRLRIAWRGLGVPVQWAEVDATPILETVFRPRQGGPAVEEFLHDFLSRDRKRGIDLEQGPLQRVSVLDLDAQSWAFVWTIHHLAMDGRGMARVLREVLGSYENAGVASFAESRSFIDYARQLAAIDTQGLKPYWQGLVSGMDEACTLPLQPPVAGVDDRREVRLSLDAEVEERLASFAESLGVTLATLTHAAWSLALWRYTGQPVVAFGATRAAPYPDGSAGACAGLCINTLPMVLPIVGAETVENFVRRVREAWIEQRPLANTPLHLVQQASPLPGGVTLHDTYTVFERGSLEQLVKQDGLFTQVGNITLHERTPNPVTLAIYQGQELAIHLEFDAARFGAGAMERLLRHFVALLTQLPSQRQSPLASLNMLSEGERAALLPRPPVALRLPAVHESIHRRAVRRPQLVALQQGRKRMRYGEFEHATNRMANHLGNLGIRRGKIVAFCLPRSIDAIITMVGILKAGAAYLPIDPSWPADRRAYIYNDSGASLVIGNSGTLTGTADVPTLNLDEACHVIRSCSPAMPSVAVRPEDLAYVIYTSGSTGQPKGVAIPHRALSAFVHGARQLYGVHRRDRVLQFASLSFDAAAEEIFPTLSRGAALVLRNDPMLDSATGFIEQCRAWKISILDLPTAFWHVIVDSLDRIEWPASIRLVIIGGEAADPAKVKRWRELLGSAVRLANTYGPTETTVAITIARLESEPIVDPVPIGVAFPHAAAYVLASDQMPLPDGVPGELCLAGPQLAQGYLGRDDLTAAAFVDAPWDASVRLYRTGDRVYRREDGALIYQGRIDRQVKIRGFRIELGEIESALREHPAVGEAAVVVRDGGAGATLQGYVSPASGEATPGLVEVLREYLGHRLPAYMVPASLMALDTLPMTTSGKVDRRALPEFQPAVHRRGRPPRNDTEREVQQIWQDVFGTDGIGCDEDFLALGGHSLLAVRIATRIFERTGVSLALTKLFAASTIEGMAKLIASSPKAAGEGEIVRVPSGPWPLTPDQRILWVFESIYPGTPAYHIPVAFRLKGPVDLELLRRGLDKVVARHEPLRSCFELVDGKPRMAPQTPFGLDMSKQKMPGAEREAIREWLTREAVRPFDITKVSLLRLATLEIEPDDHILCVTIHHLVADGWSVGVLVEEWSRACREDGAFTLPQLPLRYADYAGWLLERSTNSQAADFWRRYLAGPLPRIDWPERSPGALVEPSQGAQYPVALSRTVSRAIDELATELRVTPFSLLFALYGLTLARATGAGECVIGFSLAGRSRLEFESLVGFFIETLVLRVKARSTLRFDELVRAVGEDLLQAQEHHEIGYERLREMAGETREGKPLMQALFLMQSMALPGLELPGVECQTLNVDMGKALAELTLELYPSEEGYNGWFEYQTACLDRTTVARLTAYFGALASHLAQHPFAALNALPAWSECAPPEEIAPGPPLVAAPPPALRVLHVAPRQGDDEPPNATEQKLMREFKRVLRVRDVGVHDNFFEQGGHSLLVILLLDRIERRFGVRLAPVSVYQAPTPRLLARLIEGKAEGPDSRVLHRIRDKGSLRPLFVVGSTDMLPPLLPYLDPEQPVYSLNVFGLLPEEGIVPELSFADVARHYIEEMKRVQPRGPYRLAAYCRDTMLAFEMALQLGDQGETVDRLIAIDFFWESRSRYPKPVRHLLNLVQFGMTYVSEKMHEFSKTWLEALARLRARAAQRKVDQAGQLLAPTHRNTEFIRSYYDAVSNYHITRPFRGHVDIILVTEWGIDRLPEWEDVAEFGATVRLLKACHHNLWNPPQDQDLAALITACLSDDRPPYE